MSNGSGGILNCALPGTPNRRAEASTHDASESTSERPPIEIAPAPSRHGTAAAPGGVPGAVPPPVPTTFAASAAAVGSCAAQTARAGVGVVAWDVEPCRVRDAIHVERFAGRFDTPECLVVRRVAPDASEPLTRFGPAFAAMRAGEAAPAAGYYEIRYSCYWVAWFADVTVLLPLPSVPGDFVAIQWGRRLADAVRPLARSTLRTAVVPPP